MAQKKAQYFEEINLEILDEQTERFGQAKEEAFIKSLKTRIQNKKWVSGVLMCDDNFEEREKIEENTILIIDTKDGYEIIVEVNNSGLTAQIRENYFEKIGKKCQVKYNNNGGNGKVESQEIRKGFSVILQESTLTKDGYEFVGWSKDKEGTGEIYAGGSKLKIEEDTILYAIWEKDTVTITFEGNGGTGEMSPITVTKGKETKLPENTFQKEGYSFVKWTTNQDGTGEEYANGTNINVEEDITLYVKWEVNVTATINFNTKKITEGTTISIGGTALGSGIKQVELIIGEKIVFSEESSGTTYNKQLKIDNLNNLSNLIFNQKYDSTLKIISTSDIVKEITVTEILNYTIGNGLSFAILTSYVNNGTTFEGETILQIADITLSGTTQIGDENHKFKGTYNGANHYINGVKISSDANYVGLFGYNEGIIKNLTIGGTITKSTESSSTNYKYVGGIVAYNNGKVINCTNNVTVDATLTNSNDCLCVGGIAGGNGDSENSIVEDCNNNGEITGNVTNSRGISIGGIVGATFGISQINNSNNYGKITTNSNNSMGTYTGGISGFNAGSIYSCQNNASIEENESGGNSDYSEEWKNYCVGGITGFSDNTIQKCINNAEVVAVSSNIQKKMLVGGIAGYSQKNLMDSINNGNVNYTTKTANVDGIMLVQGGIVGWQNGSKIEGCKNTGTISGNAKSQWTAWIGGIVGGTWNATEISKCSNIGNVSSSSDLISTLYYAEDNWEHLNIGGIIGCLYKGSSVNECYNIGDVMGTLKCGISKYVLSGGITGENYGTISNCYNRGKVMALNLDTTSAMCAGGIAGFISTGGILNNSYNTNLNVFRSQLAQYSKPSSEFKGLVVGWSDGSSTNSYYLPSTNNSTYYATAGIEGGNTTGTTSKTTSQLQGLASTLGSTYWTQNSNINDGYPYLINNVP